MVQRFNASTLQRARQRRQPISAKFYGTEATKTASESEPKFFDPFSVSPRKEVKNRGHLRLHAGPTTRALR